MIHHVQHDKDIIRDDNCSWYRMYFLRNIIDIWMWYNKNLISRIQKIIQHFEELYYLLHLIKIKNIYFSHGNLWLRKSRLCTINHELQIHNNTTKNFWKFFLFFVLVFVIRKQGEKGFSLVRNSSTLKKEASTILF